VPNLRVTPGRRKFGNHGDNRSGERRQGITGLDDAEAEAQGIHYFYQRHMIAEAKLRAEFPEVK
jgi:hypothetical protein